MSNLNSDKLLRLTSMAQIGWWEADFKNQKYTLLEFIVDLLSLESDTIEFKDLHNLVHEDYRDKLREASQNVLLRQKSTYLTRCQYAFKSILNTYSFY